jgi:hypothetical protein
VHVPSTRDADAPEEDRVDIDESSGPPAPTIGARVRSALTALSAETVALAVLCLVTAVLARAIQRPGHDIGDDFALYLDQARSLSEGGTRRVIENVAFSLDNSDPSTFSPAGYPWGWPIVLAPFVAVIGLEYDTLAWIEIVLFVTALVLVHRLVRPRTSTAVALVLTAVVALSPSLLGHTDHLLSEYPHLVAVLATLLVLDRYTATTDGWIGVTHRQLAVLGVLAAVAFSMRREGVALLAAIGVAQLVGRVPWRRWATPPAAFAATVIALQVALPTALFPSYPDQGFQWTDDMLLGPLPRGIATHLSFGTEGVGWAFVVLGAAVVGAALRMISHARRDAALVAFVAVALSAYARFPLNEDDRYYIQVLPFALYFAAQLAPTAVELATVRRGGSVVDEPDIADLATRTPPTRLTRPARALSVTALSILVAVQVWHLPADVRDARAFAADGLVQWGPADPSMRRALRAVTRRTPPDAIVATRKARLLTMVTGRRAIQTGNLDLALERAGYVLVLRSSELGAAIPTKKIGARRGLTPVWDDDTWVLWRNDTIDR